MSKKIFIQNIVSPYRSNFFNSLYRKSKDFEVYYMGKTEYDRNWDYEKLNVTHKHWIDKWSIYFPLFGFHIHINPCLVLKTVFNKKASDVIMAVSYCDLNIIAFAILKHLGLSRKTYHFWAETNYLTNGARKNSWLKRVLRRYVYSAVDGYFIVPGKMSVMTFEKWGYKNNKYLFIPNTIDESNLNFASKNHQNGGAPKFIMPVRLIENIKGVRNFFESIGKDNVKKALFYVAGDGQDKSMYEQFIIENNYQDNIKLLGFCDSNMMNDLYNEVDALILPSYSDPSPLSLVEALRFHLPILCSSHCGNHFESVQEGVNGFVFSPFDKDDIKICYEKLLSCRSKWGDMGEKGGEIYEQHFKTSVIVDRISNAFRN